MIGEQLYSTMGLYIKLGTKGIMGVGEYHKNYEFISLKNYQYEYVQWNPSKMDTIREKTFILYKEVSFIQGF